MHKTLATKAIKQLLVGASISTLSMQTYAAQAKPSYCNRANLTPLKQQKCNKASRGNKNLVLDPDTGLQVVDISSDDGWDIRLKVDAPFSSLVKITSSFDGDVEYAVYDNFYNRKNCEFPLTCYRAGVITKWTPEYLSGVNYLVKTATEPLLSPIDIKHLGNTYTLYGEEGKFILPNSLIESIKTEKNPSKLIIRMPRPKTISLCPHCLKFKIAQEFPIHEKTVSSLSKLFSKTTSKWMPPKIELLAQTIQSDINNQKLAGLSLPKVVKLISSGSTGSGFLIGDGSYIMTNRHVVGRSKNKTTRVEFSDGSYDQAKIVFISSNEDFAVLKLKSRNSRSPLPICYSTYPVPGQDVLVLGSPRGLSNTITR